MKKPVVAFTLSFLLPGAGLAQALTTQMNQEQNPQQKQPDGSGKTG